MCVQIGVDFTKEELAELLGAAERAMDGWQPQERIRGHAQPVIPAAWTQQGKLRLALLRWGWDIGSASSPHLNARLETLAVKPTFRDAARDGRCLLPVRCWYEWRRNGPLREPYRLGAASGALLTLAGIRDARTGSCAVVTTAASGIAAWVHNTGLRMPLIVAPAQRASWLSADVGELAGFAADEEELEAVYLSTAPRQAELL